MVVIGTSYLRVNAETARLRSGAAGGSAGILDKSAQERSTAALMARSNFVAFTEDRRVHFANGRLQEAVLGPRQRPGSDRGWSRTRPDSARVGSMSSQAEVAPSCA